MAQRSDQKEKEKENPHKGHRERVRARFRSAGLESFPAHNLLELLLFFSVPQGDTNETAHRLIEHFGSLLHVLDAPFDELMKVSGIGEVSATLIMLVPQLANRYFEEQRKEKRSLDTQEALHSYVISRFAGLKVETAFLLCLNNAYQLHHCGPISWGTKNAVHLDSCTLLETAFRHGATKVVLAHNHPNGLAAPSPEDVACTREAYRLFRSVDIKLVDHLIVAAGECFSMASHLRTGRIFFEDDAPQQQAADII